MTTLLSNPPLIALVDDDIHSARLLCRTLSRLGAKRINWYGDAERSLRLLVPPCPHVNSNSPAMIIVDLKATSSATADFLRALRPLLPATVPMVAMAPSLERSVRQTLLDAGAAAVFERRPDQAAYREEIAALLRFLDQQAQDVAATPISYPDADPEPLFLAPTELADEERPRVAI